MVTVVGYSDRWGGYVDRYSDSRVIDMVTDEWWDMVTVVDTATVVGYGDRWGGYGDRYSDNISLHNMVKTIKLRKGNFRGVKNKVARFKN